MPESGQWARLESVCPSGLAGSNPAAGVLDKMKSVKLFSYVIFIFIIFLMINFKKKEARDKTFFR